MGDVITIGVDLAKSVFQVHGVDAAGAVVVRRQLRRRQVLPFFAKLRPCLVGIEACATAHHWGREIERLGHRVRLMPPRSVKAYVKIQKNDAADAEAICEAVTRPTMRFVELKSTDEIVEILDVPRPNARLLGPLVAGPDHEAVRGHPVERVLNQDRPFSFYQKANRIRATEAALGDVAPIGASPMHNLQDLIDTCFADIEEKPATRELSEVAIQRDQAFAKAASKLAKLRQARLQGQGRQ